MSTTTPQLHDPSQPPPAPSKFDFPQDTPVRGKDPERPLAHEEGVAVAGQPDLPEGQANIGDKIVGKTQKVIGKYTNNPELHEKGQLRETGGKAVAEGREQAVRD